MRDPRLETIETLIPKFGSGKLGARRLLAFVRRMTGASDVRVCEGKILLTFENGKVESLETFTKALDVNVPKH